MRLITPKRLRGTRSSCGTGRRQVDTFLDDGRCEFIGEFASPFAMLVIADLLGCQKTTIRDSWRRSSTAKAGTGLSGARAEDIGTVSLFDTSTSSSRLTCEDRRLTPRDDVLTGLATATFPDESTPEVLDVVRVAANLFAAGQETTSPSGPPCSSSGDAELQQILRKERHRIPQLHRGDPSDGESDQRRFPTVEGARHRSWCRSSRGATVMRRTRRPTGTTSVRGTSTFDMVVKNAGHHLAFGRASHLSRGSLGRTEARVSLERILDRTTEIRLSEEHHGPPGARR